MEAKKFGALNLLTAMEQNISMAEGTIVMLTISIYAILLSSYLAVPFR